MTQAKTFEPNTWGCPYCDNEVEADSDDQYINDVDSDITRQCEQCGKDFQLRATYVEVFFEAIPVEKDAPS